MENLSLEERHLLRLLVESKRGGAASMEVRGPMSLAAAHALEKKGLAKWHGASWGTHFYYVTDEGLQIPLTFK